MKILFIVDYWLPFPSSEYGGVDTVVADSAEQAVELLAAETGEYEKADYPDYRERIAAEVAKAQTFKVEAERVGIVYSFHT